MRIVWREKLGQQNCPYLIRWIFDFGLFSIRLHHWLSSDDDRAFHDHPWWFLTLVLWGSYIDRSPAGDDAMTIGKIRFRRAEHQHTAVVAPGGCWTLLLCGPEKREWGFWVADKFRKRNKYFFEHGHHPCDKMLADPETKPTVKS